MHQTVCNFSTCTVSVYKTKTDAFQCENGKLISQRSRVNTSVLKLAAQRHRKHYLGGCPHWPDRKIYSLFTSGKHLTPAGLLRTTDFKHNV